MSSFQGQATWRARGSSSHASASQQIQPPAPVQPPPSAATATAAGPFPPGYPNAPPVQLPPGINQQQWNQGYWRFDPKPGWTSASAQVAPGHVVYNPGLVNNNRGQPQPPPPTWMPHPHWQFPPDFNPYKRVPRPPDPSYWATELLENPLGLENMHITNDSVEGRHAHAARTPWVWTSTSLPDESLPSESSDAHDHKDARPRHRFTSASEQVESRKSLDRQDGDSHRRRDSTPSQSRSQGESRQDHLQSHSHQPPHVPPVPKQDQSMPSRSSRTPERRTSLSRRPSHDPHTPPDSSSSGRDSGTRRTLSNHDYSRPDIRASPESLPDSHRDDKGENGEEAFSKRKELHPTFSPAIVRTPKYYSERATTPVSTPTRPSFHTSKRRSSESLTQTSQSRSDVPPPLVLHLEENRSDVLSPLIGATPRPSSASIPGERMYKVSASSPDDSETPNRPHSLPLTHPISHSKTLSRSHTYPTLDPVSEDPFSQTPRDVQSARNLPLSASRKSERESTHGRRLLRSNSFHDPISASEFGRPRSPSRTSTTPSRTPSRAPSRPQSPADGHARSVTSSRQSSRNLSRPQSPVGGQTLPPLLPPDVARMQEKHPNAVPTPFTVRKGYWNRRGDHLTEGGKVVYALHDKAFPPDLAPYPSQDFMNPDGERIPFTSQEELLASLPRFGKPPLQPYDSFVKFERRWRPVDPITPP